AVARVREGKLRAAVVIPKGFGEEGVRALFRPSAGKPQVAVHYDPSQSITLALVKGLMTEHAMKAVSQAAFSGATGAKAIADAREQVQSSSGLDESERRNLLQFFDSVERLQSGRATSANASAPLAGGFSM